MRVVAFVSRRFHAGRGMPRSIRAMRAVAAAGIAVAVAALIISVAIGRGFERVYTQALLNFNSHVIVMGAGEIDRVGEILDQLRAFAFASDGQRDLARRWGWATSALERTFAALEPWGLDRLVPSPLVDRLAMLSQAARRGVLAATPFLYREGMLVGIGGIRGVVVKGIDAATLKEVSGMQVKLFGDGNTMEAALEPRPGAIPVLLGQALARSMEVAGTGATVRMLVPRESGKRDAGRDFVELLPVGTFESGLHDYDAEFLLMGLPEARRIFAAPADAVTGIELRLDDPHRARLVAAALEQQLGPVIRAISWDELNSDLLAAVRLEKLVSALIMGIMLLVAALNIVAALVLMTIFRLREIAILKAVGLPSRDVERLFVRGGMRIGAWGIGAGLAAGIGLAAAVDRFRLVKLPAEIYLVGSLPIDISPMICGMLALFCATVIWMTSRFAARRLATISPAEGLAQAR